MRTTVIAMLVLGVLLTAAAAESPDNQSQLVYNQTRYRQTVWDLLANMPAQWKVNCMITPYLPMQTDPETRALANEVAGLWNSGRWDEALAVGRSLAVRQIEIAGRWQQPLRTEPSSLLWGVDVRVSPRDSINQGTLKIHRQSGNLFAALRLAEDGLPLWTLNFSSVQGASFSETFFLATDDPLVSVSSAVAGSHCYVAYGHGRLAQLRRFKATDGTPDIFPDSSQVVTVFTADTSETIKEVCLISNQETFNNRLYYLIITSGGQLKYFWDDLSATSWTEVPTEISDANRGLDACFNKGGSQYFMFISYINTADSVKVFARPTTLIAGSDETGQGGF